VEFSDIASAARALTSLNGELLRGRAIYVREDRIDNSGSSSNGGNTRGSNNGGAASSSSHSNSSVGEQQQQLDSPRLYVNNLAWSVSWQDLKDLFKQVSNIASKEYCNILGE
jgi:RNA recognition motif-containing protein